MLQSHGLVQKSVLGLDDFQDAPTTLS
ncbi:hypothetical protein D039_4961A, partial [Vibrio parahaemolyticus EKP-028]